jgi:hypothetical protein
MIYNIGVLTKFPAIPKINPNIKAISLLMNRGIGICHAGDNALSCTNSEMVNIPESRIGAVQMYDIHIPRKLEIHTSGTKIKTTFMDSSLRCSMPDQTNENISPGRIQMMKSFSNRLRA